MIETFYGSDTLTTSAAFLSAFIIGTAFGWCLEQAGFGSSRRLAGIFYFKDMAVLKVMFSAVITAMLGLGFILKTGMIGPDSIYVPETIFWAQLIGGVIFGMGFVIGGWCPGTAAVGMVSGKLDAVVFLVGSMLGSIVFNETFVWVEPLYRMGDMGVSFFYNQVGMDFPQFALLLTVIAVFAFWFSELIEERFDFGLVAARNSGLWVFSVVILMAACGMLFLGRHPVTIQALAAGTDYSELLQNVERGLDHLEPEVFAREKLIGQKKIALVDIRTREEFDEWHISGAVHQPMNSLIQGLERYRSFDRIVLYSNGAVHPGQAWVFLSAAGFKNVYFLADGLQGFFERVLKPVSLRIDNLPENEKLEINTWRAMFLGSGMSVDAAEPVSSSALTNSP